MKYFRILFCTILLAAATTVTKAAPPPGIPDGWSDGYVYANGIRIHYYRAVPEPGKPVIVMAHGVTDFGLSWTTLSKDLQPAYDIYMVDARGHGYSDPSSATSSGDVAVDDLMGFLAAMKLEKPILMGHSMGAATVMRLAAVHPDVPRAVILLDPGLGGAPPRASASAPPAPGALVMFGTPEALVNQNNRPYEELVAQCRKQSPKWDVLDCEYWAESKKLYHGSYSASGSRFPRVNVPETLGQITAPLLILKADAPPEIRKANEEVAKAIHHGKLVHIDGAAHNLHHDQRQRTVQEITSFLHSVNQS